VRLGLSLAITQPLSGVVFNPGELVLPGWWRASYAGSPWVGTASAGGSAGQNLTEATNPPGTGAAVNGFVPADFDGTNDELTGAACSTFITTTNYGGWALVFIDAINTDNTANLMLNDAICGTTGTAEWGVYLRSTGPVVGVATASTTSFVETPIALNTWQLVQFKGNGTNNFIRVNNGSWLNGPGSTIASLAAALNVGDLAGGFLDGKILDLALLPVALTDARFNQVLSYCRARYGLAL
jgi:hypothetical protein